MWKRFINFTTQFDLHSLQPFDNKLNILKRSAIQIDYEQGRVGCAQARAQSRKSLGKPCPTRRASLQGRPT